MVKFFWEISNNFTGELGSFSISKLSSLFEINYQGEALFFNGFPVDNALMNFKGDVLVDQGLDQPRCNLIAIVGRSLSCKG